MTTWGIELPKYDELGTVGRESAEAVAKVADDAVSKAKSIGSSDTKQLDRIGSNSVEAFSNGKKFTEPTLLKIVFQKGNMKIPKIRILKQKGQLIGKINLRIYLLSKVMT